MSVGRSTKESKIDCPWSTLYEYLPKQIVTGIIVIRSSVQFRSLLEDRFNA